MDLPNSMRAFHPQIFLAFLTGSIFSHLGLRGSPEKTPRPWPPATRRAMTKMNMMTGVMVASTFHPMEVSHAEVAGASAGKLDDRAKASP